MWEFQLKVWCWHQSMCCLSSLSFSLKFYAIMEENFDIDEDYRELFIIQTRRNENVVSLEEGDGYKNCQKWWIFRHKWLQRGWCHGTKIEVGKVPVYVVVKLSDFGLCMFMSFFNQFFLIFFRELKVKGDGPSQRNRIVQNVSKIGMSRDMAWVLKLVWFRFQFINDTQI